MMEENVKLVGKIEELPTVDASNFILGAEKRIVFGPDGRFWDSHVMRSFLLDPFSVAPPNSHPWAHWALCIGGEGKYVIDGTEYDIESGSWMHVPGGLEHTFWNTSKTEKLHILCIVPKEGDVNPLNGQGGFC